MCLICANQPNLLEHAKQREIWFWLQFFLLGLLQFLGKIFLTFWDLKFQWLWTIFVVLPVLSFLRIYFVFSCFAWTIY